MSNDTNDKEYVFEPIALPSDDYRGPAQGVGTEHGDSWRVAGRKINAAFAAIFGENRVRDRSPTTVNTERDEDRPEHRGEAGNKRIGEVEAQHVLLTQRLDEMQKQIDEVRDWTFGWSDSIPPRDENGNLTGNVQRGAGGDVSTIGSGGGNEANIGQPSPAPVAFGEAEPVSDTIGNDRKTNNMDQNGDRFVISGATGNTAREPAITSGEEAKTEAVPAATEPPQDAEAREHSAASPPDPGAQRPVIGGTGAAPEPQLDPTGGANPVRAGVTPPDPAETTSAPQRVPAGDEPEQVSQPGSQALDPDGKSATGGTPTPSTQPERTGDVAQSMADRPITGDEGDRAPDGRTLNEATRHPTETTSFDRPASEAINSDDGGDRPLAGLTAAEERIESEQPAPAEAKKETT